MAATAVAVSACLCGTPCRYDAASRPVPYLAERLKNAGVECFPVCPEVAGGLPTPRTPAERRGKRVITKDGRDVTDAYRLGAERTLAALREKNIRAAIFKSRSPSCGHGEIYDGTFSATRVTGNGVTAELLLQNGIAVFTENEIDACLDYIADVTERIQK